MGMPSPSVPEPGGLDEALRLAEAMLAAAEAGDWDALVEIEARRRPLIEAAFAVPPAVAEAADLARDIERLLAIDRRIMGLAREGRDALSRALDDFSRGRRGRTAYAEVQAL